MERSRRKLWIARTAFLTRTLLFIFEGLEAVQDTFGVHAKLDGEFSSLVSKDGGMMVEKIGRKSFHQKVEAHTFISGH